MNERRRQDRIRPGIKINVFDRNTNQLFGYLADISARGMMLIGEKLILRDGIYQLRMQLPVELDGKHEVIFDAESIWCKCDPDSYYSKAGFRLHNVSQQDQRIIELLVKTREFQNMTNCVPS
ncbi:MAG: PilZ domain-containing protein [Candidatus Zixiibacteriota bacterium]